MFIFLTNTQLNTFKNSLKYINEIKKVQETRFNGKKWEESTNVKRKVKETGEIAGIKTEQGFWKYVNRKKEIEERNEQKIKDEKWVEETKREKRSKWRADAEEQVTEITTEKVKVPHLSTKK